MVYFAGFFINPIHIVKISQPERDNNEWYINMELTSGKQYTQWFDNEAYAEKTLTRIEQKIMEVIK